MLLDGQTKRPALQGTTAPHPGVGVGEFRKLLDQLTDGAFEVDIDGCLVWISDSVTAMLGWRPVDLIGTPYFNYMHPDDRAELARAERECDSAAPTPQLRWLCRDGSFRPLRIRATAVRDAAGHAAGFIGTFCAEQATRDLDGFDAFDARGIELMEAQRLARLGSWMIDRAWKVQHWSDELYRIYGLDPADGTPDFDALMAAHDDQMRANIGELLANAVVAGEPFEVFYDITRRDGSYRRLFARGEPVRNAQGAIVGLRGTAQDMTESAEAEAARQRRLTHRAAYLSRVEHSLRTNLSVVQGWIELIEDDDTMDEATRRRALSTIARNASALTAQVEGLMSEAMQAERAQAVELVPLDVAAMAAELAEEYATLYGMSEVRVSPRRGVRALCSAEPLVTVIRHLLENAFHYAGADGIVEVRCDRKRTGTVELSVRDTGPGIAPEVELFTAFSKDPHSKGHGLGLHVVQTMVDAMQGEVVGRNRGDGRGAEFVVSLRADR